MTNIELSAILDRIGNPTGQGLAALHNTGPNLPNRWLNGKSRIPDAVAVWWRALDAWVAANPAPRGW